MQKNVLEYFENTKHLTSAAFEDESAAVSFCELYNQSRRVGSALLPLAAQNRTVAVLCKKSVVTPALFFGVLWAGLCYVPISPDMPALRLSQILEVCAPELILTDGLCSELCLELGAELGLKALTFSECLKTEIDEAGLALRMEKQTDTDPAYVVFTSGSSGRPKGVAAPHRALIDYIDVFAETFGISGLDVIGAQSPPDYIAAIRDLYLPLKTGAKTVFIPKTLFSTPKLLLDFVAAQGCTVLPWVSSAISLCAKLKALDETVPESVKTVFFTGSVLPAADLKYWQEKLGTTYVNHYGPTEITASCSYYIFDHIVAENEVVPIGKPFINTKMFIGDELGNPLPDGEKGEIFVGGTCLALGYFGDADATARAFVRLPPYGEVFYRTGDVGSVGTDGFFRFHGRRDFQIKHMGHRIELSEIENAARNIAGIDACACLYDGEKSMLALYFVGAATPREIALELRKFLPSFMVPRKFFELPSLPLNTGGKTDYAALAAKLGGSE